MLGKQDTEESEWIGNKLTELPGAIAQLVRLIVLDISDSQLTKIPEWITQLTNLTRLNLSTHQPIEILKAIDHPAIKPVVALLKGFMDAK